MQKRVFSGVISAATFLVAACESVRLAYAGGSQILANTVSSKIVELYGAAWNVITVLAALMLIFAFVMRMLSNQQRAQIATQWIVRIIVCYLVFNCSGFLFTAINGISPEWDFSTDTEIFEGKDDHQSSTSDNADAPSNDDIASDDNPSKPPYPTGPVGGWGGEQKDFNNDIDRLF